MNASKLRCFYNLKLFRIYIYMMCKRGTVDIECDLIQSKLDPKNLEKG